MKTENKTFDCLKFKAESQEALRRATEGMTPQQELAFIEARVAEGPFKDLLARVKESETKRSGTLAT